LRRQVAQYCLTSDLKTDFKPRSTSGEKFRDAPLLQYVYDVRRNDDNWSTFFGTTQRQWWTGCTRKLRSMMVVDWAVGERRLVQEDVRQLRFVVSYIRSALEKRQV